MNAVRLAPVLGLPLVLAVACSGRGTPAASDRPSASPGPERTVIGFITEIEFGKLSLRTTEDRSLIFSLTRSPAPVAGLEEDMVTRSPVRIRYRVEGVQLVALAIEPACPGPECPPLPSPRY